MKRLSLLIFLSFTAINFAQDSLVTTIDTASVYQKYREDQFYLGLTFNLLTNKPEAMEQNGFSGGLQFGFIRDMPINKQRNWAIGVGAGISMNTYNQNLFVGEPLQKRVFFRLLMIKLTTTRTGLRPIWLKHPYNYVGEPLRRPITNSGVFIPDCS